MTTIIGNLVAIILIVIAALFGFISLQASATSFIIISYGIWLLVLIANLVTNPSKSSPFCELLSSDEIDAYRRFHISIWFPGAAQAYSLIMNDLRLAGIIWGGISLWNSLYWHGAFSIAFFFVASGLIVKLSPWLYMGAEAQKGNQVALEQLTLIEQIQQKRAVYNAE